MYEPSRHLATYFIAGFQHYDGALVLDELKPGMYLDMQHEADNPYDPCCVTLRHKGTKLGYVPKHANADIALASFYGHDIYEMRVLQVDPEADPWEQVRVGLYLKDNRE